MNVAASIMPAPPSSDHRRLIERLSRLVGQRFEGYDACWRLVRAGLIDLGADVPREYAACAGIAQSLGKPTVRQLALGDVLIFAHRDDDDRQHVALALGDGRAMHAPAEGVCVERISSLRRQYQLIRAARLKCWVEGARDA